MRNQSLIFILTSVLPLQLAQAAELPAWITGGATADSSYLYVVCSHDGLDPEDVRQVAESKCLASAAKLGGVTVTLHQKTVQSLTGADSSEVAEIEPLKKDIDCEWTNRFLERVGNGFRVWLRCRVKRGAVTFAPTHSGTQESPGPLTSSRPSAYKRAVLNLTTVPEADRILVGGQNGVRVLEVQSNMTSIELKEGDEYIVAEKQKYKDSRFDLKEWKHGDSLGQTLYLQPEM
jgi:hypothetical protein